MSARAAERFDPAMRAWYTTVLEERVMQGTSEENLGALPCFCQKWKLSRPVIDCTSTSWPTIFTGTPSDVVLW